MTEKKRFFFWRDKTLLSIYDIQNHVF